MNSGYFEFIDRFWGYALYRILWNSKYLSAKISQFLNAANVLAPNKLRRNKQRDFDIEYVYLLWKFPSVHIWYWWQQLDRRLVTKIFSLGASLLFTETVTSLVHFILTKIRSSSKAMFQLLGRRNIWLCEKASWKKFCYVHVDTEALSVFMSTHDSSAHVLVSVGDKLLFIHLSNHQQSMSLLLQSHRNDTTTL